MPRIWSGRSIPWWFERGRRPGWRLLLQGLASVVAAGCLVLSAGETAPPAGEASELLDAVRTALAGSCPGVDPAALLDYYSRTSPDIHAEIRHQVESGNPEAPAYLRRLADHFQRLDRVRQRSPAEYDRLMALDLLESRGRMLGRLILQLAAALADGSADDTATTRAAMNRAREELRGVLERSFDSTQQNQRIELNRLEAELRTMRRLLDERAAKRDLIVQQRFLELCGQELPPSARPPAAAPSPASPAPETAPPATPPATAPPAATPPATAPPAAAPPAATPPAATPPATPPAAS